MKRFVYFVALLMAMAAAPCILLSVHEGFSGFVHRQLAYRVIAQHITEPGDDALTKVKDVMAYVHLNEAELGDWSLSEDVHVLHDMVNHIGWSDQKANAMAHLLHPVGVDARMVLFPCHSFAEVQVENRLLLFDPDGNQYFFDRDMPDQIAGLEAVLRRSQELMTSSGTDWEGYAHSNVADCGLFQRYDFPGNGMPLHKRMAAATVGLLHRLGGIGLARSFNNWHLARYHSSVEQEFYRIRCHQLFNDAPDAASLYGQMTGERARFFQFRSLVETGDMVKAHEVLIDFQRMTSNGPVEDARYITVMQDYLTKLRLMDGSQLMRTLNLSESQLRDLFHMLDVAASE